MVSLAYPSANGWGNLNYASGASDYLLAGRRSGAPFVLEVPSANGCTLHQSGGSHGQHDRFPVRSNLFGDDYSKEAPDITPHFLGEGASPPRFVVSPTAAFVWR